MSDHRLIYNRTGGGFLAYCQCGDFHAFVEGDGFDAELAILNLHVFHLDNPELGKR